MFRPKDKTKNNIKSLKKIFDDDSFEIVKFKKLDIP